MKTTKQILFTVLALFLLLESCDLSTIFDKDKENLGTEYPSGFVKNPKTGAIYNPKTGATYDPTTGTIIPDGFVVDPVTGKIYNPDTGEVYDPKTGEVTDPATGETTSSYDPKTGNKLPDGFIIDPVTGKIYNPDTGEVYDPVTGKITNPDTGEVKAVYDPKTGLIETTNPETGDKEYRSSGGIQYNKDGTVKEELYYFLSILTPVGGGKVLVENDGFKRELIDYEKSKVYPIVKNTSVQVNFIESNGYKFDSWVGFDSSVDATQNPLTFTMDKNLFIQLTGVQDSLRIFITENEGEQVDVLLYNKIIDSYEKEVNGNRKILFVVKGTELELRAKGKKPILGFILNGVTVKKNPYFYTVNENTGITLKPALDITDRVTLDVAKYPLDSSEISLISEGENIVPIINTAGKSVFYLRKNAPFQLKGIPKNNFNFLIWGGDFNLNQNPIETSISEDSNTSFITEPKTKIITIAYNIEQTSIRLTVDGILVPEKISPEGKTFYEIQKGDSVEFEAIPKSGFLFKEWIGDLTRTKPNFLVKINSDTNFSLKMSPAFYTLGLIYENVEVTVESDGQLILPFLISGKKRSYKIPINETTVSSDSPTSKITKISVSPFKDYTWLNWSGEDLTTSLKTFTTTLSKDTDAIGATEKIDTTDQYGNEIKLVTVNGLYFGTVDSKVVPATTPYDFAKTIRSKVNKDRENDKPTVEEILKTPFSTERTKNYKWYIRLSRRTTVGHNVHLRIDYKFHESDVVGKQLLNSSSDYYKEIIEKTDNYKSADDILLEGKGSNINISAQLDFKEKRLLDSKAKSKAYSVRWVRDTVYINRTRMRRGPDTLSERRILLPSHTSPLPYSNHFGIITRTMFNLYKNSWRSDWIYEVTNAKIPIIESDTGEFNYVMSYNKVTSKTPTNFIFKKIEALIDFDAIKIVDITPRVGVRSVNKGTYAEFTFKDEDIYYFTPGTPYKVATITIESLRTKNRKDVELWLK